MEKLKEEVRLVLIEIIGSESFTNDDLLFSTQLIGSMDLLVLIDELESKFFITIEASEVNYANIDSVDKIVEFINAKQIERKK